jgi:hypothetical protein
MPVDLSPAGLPSAYPAHGPRFWPWLLGWLLCCGLGAAVVLLLWPAGTPARGTQFWLCLLIEPRISHSALAKSTEKRNPTGMLSLVMALDSEGAG